MICTVIRPKRAAALVATADENRRDLPIEEGRQAF